jgi:tRNA modification GTPase
VVLVGRPNAGKSSLLNTLLQADRAIVTPVPGTTRDVLTEVMDLAGVPVTLVDTAGVTDTADVVERLGIARTRQELVSADVVMLVLDGAQAPAADDRLIASQVADCPCVTVLNKADLPTQYPVATAQALVPSAVLCTTSALTGDGLDRVRAALQAALVPAGRSDGGEPLLGSTRHVDSLRRASVQLAAARQTLGTEYPLDMLTVDLRGALDTLGEITGQTVTEEVLDQIFSTFCIGK